MLDYDQYGDVEGCTHKLTPEDMGQFDEVNETRRAAVDSIHSLANYGLAMRSEVGKRQAALTDALQDVTNLQHSLKVAHDFIRWVVQISEAGPRVELEYLRRRADRALLGHERADSHPPRPR